MEIRTLKAAQLKPAEYNPRRDLQPEDAEYKMIARVYADLIRKGLKTLESVPEAIREEVSKILNPDEENAGEE